PAGAPRCQQGRPPQHTPPMEGTAMTTTTAPPNPVALQNRAARRAARAAYRAAPAAREAQAAAGAAVSDEQPPADHWDTPVPYALTGAAEDVLTPAADGDALAPARTVALSPVALHALAAAVKGATAHPSAYTPVLEVARVTLADGALSIVATDRFR